MSIPIVEFEQEAFSEPSRVIRPRAMPSRCILCSFREVIEKVTAESERERRPVNDQGR